MSSVQLSNQPIMFQQWIKYTGLMNLDLDKGRIWSSLCCRMCNGVEKVQVYNPEEMMWRDLLTWKW